MLSITVYSEGLPYRIYELFIILQHTPYPSANSIPVNLIRLQKPYMTISVNGNLMFMVQLR